MTFVELKTELHRLDQAATPGPWRNCIGNFINAEKMIVICEVEKNLVAIAKAKGGI